MNFPTKTKEAEKHRLPTMSTRVKKIIYLVAKYAVGAAIIYWLSKSDLIHFQKIRAVPISMIAFGLFLIFIQEIIASFRIFYLLRKQQIHLTLWSCFIFNCLGVFYSLFLPGGVSGDVARGYFFIRHVGESKLTLVGSLIMDRVVGLLTLVALGLISAFFLLFYFPWLRTYFIIISLFFVLALIFLFYVMRMNKEIQVHPSENYFTRIIKKTINFIRRLNLSRYSFRTIAYAVSLSAIVHLLAFFLIYLCSRYMHSGLRFIDICTISPIGLMINSIPISPGGIGVGEQSFEFLYKAFGAQNGAMSFLIARFFIYSPAILGAIFSLLFFLKIDVSLIWLKKNKS